ncbi:MAG: YifB family Mg chelatase-like AAA ATPase [Holosporales bacterium]|nr:YifB family Mg chelatase-like AAA ATPase [Holosporales bacterium]
MLSKLSTIAFNGIETQEVSVEVQISSGLPMFTIVGLPDKAVAESKERIRASFFHLGLSLPQRRIVVNLAPTDIQKEGAHYDLPIALGIMGALDMFDKEQLKEYVILGGLSLDALVSPVVGVLPSAIFAYSTNRSLICPAKNRNEAIWAGQDLQIVAAPDLISLCNHFKGEQIIAPPELPSLQKSEDAATYYGDMSEIKGQYTLKRVMEIAAAGGHNVLMIGPPGAGKSMISQRLMSILPRLEPQEAIEVTMIYSIAGMLPENGLMSERPFRAPHHSASLASLVGGGIRAKPGEISLAHNGVLFLDELPEFSRVSLEALRQPLETGNITVARVNQHVTYPAKIQLIAAMNPCRCGYFGTTHRECARAPKCAVDYQSKISGPLLDRFDLVVYVPQLPISDLISMKPQQVETSCTIQQRVQAAVNFSKQHMSEKQKITKIDELSEEAQGFLRHIAEKMQLSARGCCRVMNVARTIANLLHSADITQDHLCEAINYRYSLTSKE